MSSFPRPPTRPNAVLHVRQNRPAAGLSNTVPNTTIDPTEEPVWEGSRAPRGAPDDDDDCLVRVGSAGRDFWASMAEGGATVELVGSAPGRLTGVTCREDEADEVGVQ